MPLVPLISVECLSGRPGRATEVTLGEVTESDARQLFPLPAKDPGLNYIFPRQRNRLTARGASDWFMDRIVDNDDNVVWGVSHRQRWLGFASLTLSETTGLPGYMLVLHPEARTRGIGILATVGVVAAAFQEGVLRRANERYRSDVDALYTYIHPDNVASQRMCERVGFEREDDKAQVVGDLFNRMLTHEYTVVAEDVLKRCSVAGGSIAFTDRREVRYGVSIST